MIREIDSSLSSFQIYSLFKDDEHSFILDSATSTGELGRYSYISARPFQALKFKDSSDDPLIRLEAVLKKFKVENDVGLPFVGGAVGYFAYDLCNHFERLPQNATDDLDMPDLYVGLYDWVVVIDHRDQKKYVATPGLNEEREEEKAREICEKIESRRQKQTGIQRTDPVVVDDFSTLRKGPTPLVSNFSPSEYQRAVNRVREYIRDGDVYQVNLSQRFRTSLDVSGYRLYNELRAVSPAPYGALLNFENLDILSNSPERFFKVENGFARTRPIKGTRPRGDNPARDRELKRELLNSEKDRAELLMIVDLERNDLGRVAQIGSVEVPQLFVPEQYSNVHHLVASVRGKLRKDKTVFDLIRATFPGGSITGAPKIRAMEIIDELEPTRRSVYTGSIGYIGFNGSMNLNIAIRTMIKKGSDIYFQVGGGITWDSDPEEEYQETLDKAGSIVKTIRRVEKGKDEDK